MPDPKQVQSLRRALASALCVAQGLPVPRSSLQKMLSTLLWTAFAGLDEDSGIDRAQACAVALHALREWYALTGGSDQAVSAASHV
jgi:hypothetical protein